MASALKWTAFSWTFKGPLCSSLHQRTKCYWTAFTLSQRFRWQGHWQGWMEEKVLGTCLPMYHMELVPSILSAPQLSRAQAVLLRSFIILGVHAFFSPFFVCVWRIYGFFFFFFFLSTSLVLWTCAPYCLLSQRYRWVGHWHGWMEEKGLDIYMYTGVPYRTGSRPSFCSPVKWGTGCFTEKLFYHSGF